ncbi:MAG: hypothetical protein ACK4M5_12000 [Dietzia cercidiphylli]
MTLTIRAAAATDIDQMASLLLTDAEERCAVDAGLWRLDRNARDKIVLATRTAMEAETPPSGSNGWSRKPAAGWWV